MGYGARWQRASKQFLRENPLCRECGNRTPPIIKGSQQVDHIIPHRGDMTLFWDRKNWQALCRSCHSRKTATEDGGFGRARL
jgi:5-methylcytosine-specific restriction protein A